MKNSLRRIDLILLAAALLLAALCGIFSYALARFSPEKYEAEIAGLNAQTESVRAETLAARSETEKQLAFAGRFHPAQGTGRLETDQFKSVDLLRRNTSPTWRTAT